MSNPSNDPHEEDLPTFATQSSDTPPQPDQSASQPDDPVPIDLGDHVPRVILERLKQGAEVAPDLYQNKCIDRENRFKIKELLGKGGEGLVFRVFDAKLGHDMALKVIFGQSMEVRTGRGLDKEFLTPIYDVASVPERGATYFTMDLMKTNLMSEIITASRGGHRLEPKQVILWLGGVARGLAILHKKGVTHQDVKPPNILIDYDNNAHLGDLGAARTNGNGPTAGSTYFLSPEQQKALIFKRNTDVDHRADIYAFGLCLFTALTGEIYMGSNQDAVTRLDGLSDFASAHLQEFLKDCLANDRRMRFPNTAALLKAYENLELWAGNHADYERARSLWLFENAVSNGSFIAAHRILSAIDQGRRSTVSKHKLRLQALILKQRLLPFAAALFVVTSLGLMGLGHWNQQETAHHNALNQHMDRLQDKSLGYDQNLQAGLEAVALERDQLETVQDALAARTADLVVSGISGRPDQNHETLASHMQTHFKGKHQERVQQAINESGLDEARRVMRNFVDALKFQQYKKARTHMDRLVELGRQPETLEAIFVIGSNLSLEKEIRDRKETELSHKEQELIEQERQNQISARNFQLLVIKHLALNKNEKAELKKMSLPQFMDWYQRNGKRIKYRYL